MILDRSFLEIEGFKHILQIVDGVVQGCDLADFVADDGQEAVSDAGGGDVRFALTVFFQRASARISVSHIRTFLKVNKNSKEPQRDLFFVLRFFVLWFSVLLCKSEQALYHYPWR